jgi:hypothetical protein
MACPCCYQNVANSVVITKLPATGLNVKLISPAATVQTTLDSNLAPSLNATLDLSSVAVDLTSKPGKDTSTVTAIVRPNLSQVGAKLEIYPLKGGNFKLSGPLCLCQLGVLDLTYTSENSTVAGKYKKTGAVGPLTFTGDADFAGVSPSAASLAFGYGALKGKIAYTTKVPLAGTLFVVGKVVSFGAGAEFAAGQVQPPKLYAKYSKAGVAVSAVVALAGPSIDVRAEKAWNCSCGANTWGAVLSYAKGAPALAVGSKFVGTCGSLAAQVATNGSAAVTYASTLAGASYAVTGKWAKIKLDVATLVPSFAVDITLGKK